MSACVCACVSACVCVCKTGQHATAMATVAVVAAVKISFESVEKLLPSLLLLLIDQSINYVGNSNNNKNNYK